MGKSSAIWAYLLFLIGVFVANLYLVNYLFKNDVVEIHVFQNEKIPLALIVPPSGAAFLINTGKDASALRLLGENLPFWKHSLTSIVITMPTTEAIGGLPSVLHRYNTGSLIRFGTQGPKTLESAVSSAIEATHLATSKVPYGVRVAADMLSVDVLSANIFEISYGKTKLLVSTSSFSGTYISNGTTLTEIK